MENHATHGKYEGRQGDQHKVDETGVGFDKGTEVDDNRDTGHEHRFEEQ